MRTGSPAEICEHYSHVLRTPLGVALGILNDLLEGYDVGKPDLKDAKVALDRMLELLDELRDLPRTLSMEGARGAQSEAVEDERQDDE